MINNKGQVTIFIIIAILIVASIGLFYVFENSIKGISIPASIEPVYNQFLECLKDNTLVGVNILESQAGYIYLPEFQPGSKYMPFSSQLDFLGNPIPYWYYVSENGLEREQVVPLSGMEEDLEKYLESQIHDCDFNSYYDQEFIIEEEIPKVKVDIQENQIEVKLDMNMKIEKAGDTVLIKNHKILVDSNLGNLYNSALEVYEKEQNELFLEEYGLDILGLYAPVDGVEFTCAPKIWSADQVFNDLQQAIEDNTAVLKSKGSDYRLKTDESEYFVVNVDSDVKFMNSKNWPYSFEVNPSDEDILMAEPIGNQQGLGVMGFCYTPYHFVYNLKYPVLVRISNDEETFQFPMAVVIQGNKPRKSLEGESFEVENVELCKYKNTLTSVSAYDKNGNEISAEISYECSGDTCKIGQAPLQSNFPQCVNGYIIASAKGYEDKRYIYSTINEGSVSLILDKLYNKNINLKLDGQMYNGKAIISFISDMGSKTVLYPEQKNVELSANEYEVQVHLYKESSLKLGASVKEQCVNTIAPGLRGFLGIKIKKCFNIEIPEQIISEVLVGGGKSTIYAFEDSLENSNVIEINAESLDVPETVGELQNNYGLFETKSLEVSFI